MQRHDEFSNFRSAIEWPEMRPPREEATGELRPISSSVISTVEILSSAVTIAPDCESPIEVDLGARLSSAIRRIDDSNLLLVPQYVLGPYRYDFAIIREGKPIALIECDGRDFHSTEEQLANDRAKDDLAVREGVTLFRFSGSEIFRDGRDCVRSILQTMRFHGHLTKQQWDTVQLLLAPRPYHVSDQQGPTPGQ
jgi:very-short-patch-repair endonuclease